MTTARTISKGALRLVRAIDVTEEPEADDLTTGLENMNQMIHGWANSGIHLNYENIELTDDLPFPDRDHENIKYLLAFRLAPEYGTELTPEVATMAREAKATLQAVYGVQLEARPDLSITDRQSRYGNVYNIKTDGV